MLRKVLPAALAASVLTGAAVPAMADFSANVGFASEYYFRGIKQKESSASAGLDYEYNGLYAGTWAADVGDGLEVDAYAGYVYSSDNFSIGGGATGYYYTGDFDNTYEELNLTMGLGFLTVDYANGTHNGDLPEGGEDYDILQVTAEASNGFYATAGFWGLAEDDGIKGNYYEVGYGTEIGGFDVGVAGIYSDKDLFSTTNGDEADEALVFTLGKTFDL